MTFFHASDQPFVPHRDDMTIPQFMFEIEEAHPTRPRRDSQVPCLIDEASGQKVYLDDVSASVASS